MPVPGRQHQEKPTSPCSIQLALTFKPIPTQWQHWQPSPFLHLLPQLTSNVLPFLCPTNLPPTWTPGSLHSSILSHALSASSILFAQVRCLRSTVCHPFLKSIFIILAFRAPHDCSFPAHSSFFLPYIQAVNALSEHRAADNIVSEGKRGQV